MKAPRGTFKSKSYPNLFRYPYRSQEWVFRKYSSLKHREFVYATGESSNQAVAYQIGLGKFNDWIGTEEDAKSENFGRFAQAMCDRKLEQSDDVFSKNSKRRTGADYGALISAFGTLRLDQITEDRWEDYVRESTREKPQRFFNRRKALIEIVRRAQRLGLIKQLPAFRNPDAATTVGRYLEPDEIERILKHTSPRIWLLSLFVWLHGTRPGEALQYEWEWFRFDQGAAGVLDIPGRVTKTRRARVIPLHPFLSRALRELKRYATSRYVFPQRGNDAVPMQWFGKEWARAVGEARVDASIYDLRRTMITDRLRRGDNIVFLAKYVDSSAAQITKRYAQALMVELERIAR